MATRIIYPLHDGEIAIIYPTGVIAVEEIALKDVPAGVPYKFIDDEDIPKDPIFRNAWSADFSNPDGYGIGPEAWALKNPNKVFFK